MAVTTDTQGTRIRRARLSAGMTQAALARAVNTSERNIVRWENDRNAPRFVHVEAIARATGQDVDFFSTETEISVSDDDEESDPVALALLPVLMAAVVAVRTLVRDETRSLA